MRALKSLDLGQERVDADVGEVEDLVGDGLVRAEAGVVPVSLEDGRQDDVDREPLVPLLLEDVPAQLEVLGAVVREHADQRLFRRLVDGAEESLHWGASEDQCQDIFVLYPHFKDLQWKPDIKEAFL